ncbi:MAG: PAS domain S-box protein, partial [Thermodesulfovibrionales bacterium]|nr:PAS domain S-box protein [Thermodesulfovibrionales bacterium]
YSGKNLLRKRKDGTPVYINMSSALLYDEKGNKIGLVGIAEDITEHKKAYEALSESQKFLETIIETAPT